MLENQPARQNGLEKMDTSGGTWVIPFGSDCIGSQTFGAAEIRILPAQRFGAAAIGILATQTFRGLIYEEKIDVY